MSGEVGDATGAYLVSGGTSGIGAAVVSRLAATGSPIFFTGRDRTAARGVVESLPTAGRDLVEFVAADVADADDVAALFERVRDAGVPLIGAYNGAGIAGQDGPLTGVPFHLSEEAAFDWVVDVNLKGTWRLLRHELALMVEQRGGAIVNCSSVAGLRAADSRSASYTAAKHGVLGLTRAVAVEYAPYGVRVNAVCPGVIDTPMLGGMREHLLEDLRATNSAARLGTAAEVADAVYFLLSPASGYISGTTLIIDAGGLTGAV